MHKLILETTAGRPLSTHLGTEPGRTVIWRQLLWHRHRMVQARTRIMNQLQAVALNEGLRCKKRLWRGTERPKLETYQLAPWARRRRRDLLDLLERINPTKAELSQAVEQEVEKCLDRSGLATHPGVGPLTAMAFRV